MNNKNNLDNKKMDECNVFNRNKNKNKSNKNITINHYHFGDSRKSPALSETEQNMLDFKPNTTPEESARQFARETINKYSLNTPLHTRDEANRYTPVFINSKSQNGSPVSFRHPGFILNDDSQKDNLKFIHIIKPSVLAEKLDSNNKKESEDTTEEKLIEIIFTEEIKHISDLIDLSKKYEITPNKKYSIDLHKLNKIVPHLNELNEMIGMNDIKKSLTYQLMYFLQGFEFKHMLHTIIEGPPGVGKTCLGKILGKIYLDLNCINTTEKSPVIDDEEEGQMSLKKLISVITQNDNDQKKKVKFKIAKRSDLVGQYVGHTAVKTQKIINESFGGVLFIDEAYSLGGDDAFSKECINTINQNLSENGDKFICIIAGYSDALESSFFSYNSGLHRRFPFRFKIDKYSGDELTQILINKLEKEKYKIDQSFNNSLNKFIEENKDYFPNFGGDIETYFFHVKMMHSTRVFGKPMNLRNIFIKEDFVNALEEMKNNKKKDDTKLDFYS